MKRVILFALIGISFSIKAQVQTVQPKIMVVPFTKEGEDIRTVLENDADKRIVLTKIKEGFDNRGFTTVDFLTRLKVAKDNQLMISDNQTDVKTQIIEMSGADIYIDSEIVINKSSGGNSVKIILQGNEASTGNSLANKVGDSGRFYTEDYGKLASKAVESIIDDFLNVMQTKFTEIVNNGKSVIVDISFAQDSPYTTASEIGTEGLTFADVLEQWMEENAFKNNYHIQGTTDLKMIFDEVKIPLKDPINGRNYNPNKFALQLYQYLRKLDIQAGRDIKGNTIYITIK